MELLYDLIESLSREEKAAFSRFGTMVAGNRDDRIRELYGHIGEAIRNGNRDWKKDLTPVLKKHCKLYSSRLLARIMQSQRTYSSGRSVRSQLSGILADIDFLYRKKQFTLCWRKLRKGKKLAREFEMESCLLDFLQWERHLHAFSSTQNRAETYQALTLEAKAVSERLGQQWELLELLEETMALARKEVRIRTPEVARQFESLLAHPLIAGQIGKDRFVVWHTRQMVHGIYYTCCGNYPEALSWLRPLYLEWESRPKWIGHEPHKFLRACNAFLSCLIFSEGELQELESVFARIRNRNSLSLEMRAEFEQMSYYQELLFSLNYQSEEKLKLLLKELAQWIEKSAHLLNPTRHAVLLYNMTLAAFCYDDHDTAMRWNNSLLRLGQGHERLDILDFARIFQLILQFERGNFDLNAYLSRSAYRYFRRTDKLEQFERILIRVIGKLANALPGTDLRPTFESLVRELSDIAQQSEERNPVGLNIVLIWADAKIQQRRLSELTAENAADLRRTRENRKSGPGAN